jgi:pseudouridine-5'-phosphate glycosidase
MILIAEAVKAAIQNGSPVVALESTIISHGMPYPRNVETALRVEQTVRDAGAVPATCAIINGQLKAGLSIDEIEILGRLGHAVTKASRRDLPYLLSQKMHGATTVASTMIIAHKAGIKVFATGGIGGVHRGAETTMDISADLQELAQTPVAVVCAGVKSILDIRLTLEYLETYGVPVIGFGTDEFPAFYSRESGFGVDCRLDSPEEVAALIRAKWAVDQRGGVVIANPVPAEFSQNAKIMEEVIQQALLEAHQKGVKGKAITPFLLARIEQLTGGESLQTNIELVCNNAALAAKISLHY